MTTTTLFRLSGLALLAAVPIHLAGWLLHPRSERIVDLLSPFQTPSHLLMFASWLLVLLGLPGLYAYQANKAGVLGLIGFCASVFTAVNVMFIVLYEASPAVLLALNPTTQEAIAPGGPLSHGGDFVGGILAMVALLAYPLFGIATLRARVFPRAVGWLQVAAVFLGMVPTLIVPDDALQNIPGPVQPIAFLYYAVVLAYAIGGYVLWQAHSQPASAPATRYSAAQPVTR